MFTFFPFLDFSTIRIAKKPAIKPMKAATPPFAAKEPAADEVVEELAVGLPTEALDLPAALDPPVTLAEVNGTGLGVAPTG
jgi:hypothetical protein